MASRVYPMFLIISSLVLLVMPGVLFNTYASTGFKTADPALACHGPFAQGVPIDVTCQGTVTEGCQASAANCSLTTNPSLSLLNQNSPFTQLISGNIFGLFGSLISNGNQNRGPFDPNGGGPAYTADCFVFNVLAGNEQNITKNNFAADIKACTATNADGSNMTKYACGTTTTCFTIPGSSIFKPVTWGNWNYNALGTGQVSIPFFQITPNATWGFQCLNQGYWFLSTQTTIGYSLIGCDYYQNAGYSPPAKPNVTPVYSFLLAVPCHLSGGASCKSQTYPTGNSHVQVFIQPEQWDTWDCTNAFTVLSRNEANWYGSQQCTNMETWFNSPHNGASFNLGAFTPFLTLLIGIVLFLIGTGINLAAGGSILGSGTQFSIGTNAQGTRLAQIMGLGLIVWTPLYSEFSTWFSSGLLPFGLDGTIVSIATGSGIIAFAITGLFFVGIVWQALQID